MTDPDTLSSSAVDAADCTDKDFRAYFKACHARVAPFSARHFAYPGAWVTNRWAFGLDLLRAPLNLAWAPIFVLCQILAGIARRLGLPRITRAMHSTPPGLRTDVERYIVGRIEAELLGLAQPSSGTPYESDQAAISAPPRRPELSAALTREALAHYGGTRTASADIGNSVASTLVGAFALKAFTPGGVAIGLYVAGRIANHRAVDGFWLGEALGTVWYRIFPVDPGYAETALGIGLTLACLATAASFSGLILDPLQHALGIHQRRLHKLLDALQRDVRARTGSRYRPPDALLARILDAVDAARGTLPIS